MGFETVARTHVGCRRRINEDAVLARPDLGLWAVGDGMGGHDAGEVASAVVVEALAACRSAGDPAARAAEARRQLVGANARLIEMAAEGGQRRTIGATVVALLAGADAYVCLWAGDSRAYLARAGGLARLTHDHSLVQRLVDAGELDPAQAETHPDANVVTRAVGAAPTLDLDAAAGEVLSGDVFLIASDGLTRLVSDAELLAALRNPSLPDAADQLLETCLARGAPDNVSFVIVGPAPPAA